MISGLIIDVVALKKEEPKIKNFIIFIDDMLGLYKNSLMFQLKKHSKNFNDNAVKNVKYGSYLYIHDKKADIMYDVRDLVFQGIPMLSLVKDYEKISNLLEEVYIDKKDNLPLVCKNCPLNTICGILKDLVEEEKPLKVYDGEFISVEEKVQIFTNYVKVGYDTYPLFMYKNKVVFKTEDAVFEVKRDGIFGKQYIQELV